MVLVMAKVTVVTKVLNVLLQLILLASLMGFLSFANFYGVFWAAVTGVILYGVNRQQRWAYFACAAWALACYQLAKLGYEFESVKRWVMLLGFLVIGLAIYLHETLGKKAATNNTRESDHS